MGRRDLAGPQRASRTYWAIFPRNSAVEPPVPGSVRCAREERGAKRAGGKRGSEAEINRLRQTEEGGGEGRGKNEDRWNKGREEKERRLGLMWMFHAVLFLLFELTNFSEWGHLFPQLKTPWGDVSSDQTADNNEWHSISFLLSSYIDFFMQLAQFSLSY